MKKVFLALFASLSLSSSIMNAQTTTETGSSKVYFVSDISPESLVKIYKALGKEATGKVAVKISTGESAQSNHLRPELIEQLVKDVDGTLVECNTAYGGNRSNTASHRRAIEQRGYGKIATVDIMDEEGHIDIPVADTKYLKFDRVGSHLANYDFLINLAHFKGHAMGGFGGVLKNQSIGIATPEGKTLIHTAGVYDNPRYVFQQSHGQDGFLESMAAAAQAVHNYFKGNAIYINVMNNLSVDCDCDGHPAAPQMKDIGILASLDPVALDKACLDLIFNHQSTTGDNSAPLVQRINSRHGAHIVDYAAEIGLGSLAYELIDITEVDGIESVPVDGVNKYNVYDLNGMKILTNADNLDSLPSGLYIINGVKTLINK
ncbi:MAG: DUF362 domain-containing protein [Bacteroidaceae bacterium]|nr:DUF362 domain-containing protein [Bacteroidaceae bacterium]